MSRDHGRAKAGRSFRGPSPNMEIEVDKDYDENLRYSKPAYKHKPGNETLYMAADRRSLLAVRGTSASSDRNASNTNMRDPEDLQSHDLQSYDLQSPDQTPGSQATSETNTKRMPGPLTRAAKPMRKNDLAAKVALIHEIESYWGKDFIKQFIPKCHHPLVKGERKKRHTNRKHDADPMNWMPSVLKQILMIAKLTDNKEWLKEAMNEVVRYRIKHTGNRKAQLVSTDFDILDDMLSKQWSVAYSFRIRYKHLLNQTKKQETDEDIEHILKMSESEDDGTIEKPGDGDVESKDAGEEYEVDVSRPARAGFRDTKQAKSYMMLPHPSTTSSQSKKSRDEFPLEHLRSPKPSTHEKTQQRPPTYGFGAPLPGPSTDLGSRPMPGYDGLGALRPYSSSRPLGSFNDFGGYSTYPTAWSEDIQQRLQLPQASMQPPPLPAQRIAPGAHSQRGSHAQTLPTAPSNPSPRSTNTPSRRAHQHPPHANKPLNPIDPISGRPKIKRESPIREVAPLPVLDLDGEDSDVQMLDGPPPKSRALVDAERETAQLERKIARLRAEQEVLREKHGVR